GLRRGELRWSAHSSPDERNRPGRVPRHGGGGGDPRGRVDRRRRTGAGGTGRLTPGDRMLELRNVTAGYGDTTVLRDVSIVVPDSTVVALLGPNGAGKTTT